MNTFYSPYRWEDMRKFIVIPRDNGTAPYTLPIQKAETTITVAHPRHPHAEPEHITLMVNLVIPDWAPNETIRIEGFTKIDDVAHRVLAYYKLNSADLVLGELHIQDA